MKPIVPLKTEHGLIDQMIKLARDETHHGKEEDILFRELKDKDLSAEDRQLMEELIQEHVDARELVGELVAAKDKVLQGDHEALETVVRKLAGDCVGPDSSSSTRNTSGRKTTSSSQPQWRTSRPPSRRL